MLNNSNSITCRVSCAVLWPRGRLFLSPVVVRSRWCSNYHHPQVCSTITTWTHHPLSHSVEEYTNSRRFRPDLPLISLALVAYSVEGKEFGLLQDYTLCSICCLCAVTFYHFLLQAISTLQDMVDLLQSTVQEQNQQIRTLRGTCYVVVNINSYVYRV